MIRKTSDNCGLSEEVKAIKKRLGTDGIHLFDRSSGVNILLEEIQVPQIMRSLGPRFVSFALTNACDLPCAFCYAPKHPAQLNFDHVLNWANELDNNGTLGIGFGGGEPTLYPRFEELCTKIAASTQLAISFTTHAHHLTPQLCNDLTGRVHFIRVSMDGLGSTYERIRKRSFAVFLQHLQLASRICPFGINYVVNEDTVSQLDEAASLVFDLGATELLLLPEVSHNGLSGSTQTAMFDWVSANRDRYRLSISESSVIDGMPIANPFSTEIGTHAYIHVNASGQVSRTSHNQSDAVAINPSLGILAAIAEYRRGRE